MSSTLHTQTVLDLPRSLFDSLLSHLLLSALRPHSQCLIAPLVTHLDTIHALAATESATVAATWSPQASNLSYAVNVKSPSTA